MRTMLLSTLLLMGACDRKHDDSKPVTTSKTVEAEQHDNLAEERTELRRWFDERMTRLDARIAELEKKGDEKSQRAAESLRAKRDQARAKLSDLGDRTKDNWNAFKKDVQDWWDQVDRDDNDATR